MIPKIIHQTWKSKEIPEKWAPLAEKVKTLNPDWEYRIWTDEDNDNFVKTEFPDFFPVFNAFPKIIMKADVIRYLIMYKIGGVYLDLDYEMLQPFSFTNEKVVIPLNRSLKFGDDHNGLGNCFFASEPNNNFWLDVITDLKNNPPKINSYTEVIDATGPMLLTRIYNTKEYKDLETPERLIYHPPTPKNDKEYQAILNNGVSLGIHHVWGSWRERYTLDHLMNKLKRLKKKG